ncbi:phosphatidate cytidylyltransferase [Afifella pfennigii]|uniref:phosphatidate cytidylyltransferase n=1 Tax=Afifella pfennigii TaxID=209897 RepID=UPI00047B5017|nr:phosphatidate cytidylyltransferase [Afifella pfennigii]
MQIRTISALLLLPLAIIPAWLGGVWFLALILALAAIVYVEFTRMTGAETPLAWRIGMGALMAFALVIATGGFFWGAVILLLLPLLTIPMISSGTIVFEEGLEDPAADRRPRWLALGVLYAGLPSAALLALRADPEVGLLAIFFVFLIVWVTDISAFFGGRSLGGQKLAPGISPSKTISGALIGLGAAVMTGIVFALFTRAGLVAAIFAAVVLSLAAQAGDLGESWLKRRFGVKDTGNLIPGHGGFMDRVDGLYAAAIAAVILAFMGLSEPLPG